MQIVLNTSEFEITVLKVDFNRIERLLMLNLKGKRHRNASGKKFNLLNVIITPIPQQNIPQSHLFMDVFLFCFVHFLAIMVNGHGLKLNGRLRTFTKATRCRTFVTYHRISQQTSKSSLIYRMKQEQFCHETF